MLDLLPIALFMLGEVRVDICELIKYGKPEEV
jgi:hypothetical protein